VRGWWKRRSFKVRLTLWYAAVTAFVLATFAVVAYEVVEHRLAAEIDRQLRIDFDLVEAQLDKDSTGRIRWLVHGAHGDEGFARLSAWFEVWSEDGRLLLRHWPVPEENIKTALPPPLGSTLRFHGVELEQDLHVRLMERPARVGETGVVMRLFRDETDMRRTAGNRRGVPAALPFAMLAASLGGFLMAQRSLRPLPPWLIRRNELHRSRSPRGCRTRPDDNSASSPQFLTRRCSGWRIRSRN
jgi:hypothetical protein